MKSFETKLKASQTSFDQNKIQYEFKLNMLNKQKEMERNQFQDKIQSFENKIKVLEEQKNEEKLPANS